MTEKCLRRVSGPIAAALLLVATALTGAEQEAPPIKVGLLAHDAAKYNVEFQKYNRLGKFFAERNIKVALIEIAPFNRRLWAPADIDAMLNGFHAVVLGPSPEGIREIDDEDPKRAEIAGAALARYVSRGGGLFLDLRAVRYSNDETASITTPAGITGVRSRVWNATAAA